MKWLLGWRVVEKSSNHTNAESDAWQKRGPVISVTDRWISIPARQIFTFLRFYFGIFSSQMLLSFSSPSSHGLTPRYLESFSLSIHIKTPGYRMNQSQTSLLQS